MKNEKEKKHLSWYDYLAISSICEAVVKIACYLIDKNKDNDKRSGIRDARM